MKREILVITVSAAVLAVMIAVIFMLQDIIKPPAACKIDLDCSGSCAGSWECASDTCLCKTSSTPSGDCQTSQDCEGLAHIMCIGQWFCEAGKCEWYCEVEQGEPKAGDRVLFVEQHTSTNGELIGGSYPIMFIDFPTYSFDEEAKTLSGADFNLTGLLVIYGSGESLSGDAGSGTATKLTPIYSVPTKAGDDTITRIWEDGKVAVMHNGQLITISPNETWNETLTEEKAAPYQTGLIRLTTIDTIKNYGWISKANIEGSLGAA